MKSKLNKNYENKLNLTKNKNERNFWKTNNRKLSLFMPS